MHGWSPGQTLNKQFSDTRIYSHLVMLWDIMLQAADVAVSEVSITWPGVVGIMPG